MPSPINLLLLALMAYFILMNVTVERCYCKMTMGECAAEKWLLAVETIDFCTKYNPLFLARPEYLRVATCWSAYVFVWGYVLIAIAAFFDMWSRLKVPLAIFIGAKLNAIAYYHIMEFLSSTPPPALVPYFGVEGPYIVSIGIVIYKLVNAPDEPAPKPKRK